MSTYWLTFRLHESTIGGRTYERRYEDLMQTLEKLSTMWWTEPTSFVAFESNHSIEAIAASCKQAIAPTEDLVLIRVMDTKSALVVGKVKDQDIFKLMPYLKKV